MFMFSSYDREYLVSCDEDLATKFESVVDESNLEASHPLNVTLKVFRL